MAAQDAENKRWFSAIPGPLSLEDNDWIRGDQSLRDPVTFYGKLLYQVPSLQQRSLAWSSPSTCLGVLRAEFSLL
ncbi:hypothetical protein LEMLEM_LOCUS25586 [Lemmus lemmus]